MCVCVVGARLFRLPAQGVRHEEAGGRAHRRHRPSASRGRRRLVVRGVRAVPRARAARRPARPRAVRGRGVVDRADRGVDRRPGSGRTRATQRRATSVGPRGWRRGCASSTSSGTSRRSAPDGSRARSDTRRTCPIASSSGSPRSSRPRCCASAATRTRRCRSTERATEIAQRFGDRDLLGMAIHTQGLILIDLGPRRRGRRAARRGDDLGGRRRAERLLHRRRSTAT